MNKEKDNDNEMGNKIIHLGETITFWWDQATLLSADFESSCLSEPLKTFWEDLFSQWPLRDDPGLKLYNSVKLWLF